MVISSLGNTFNTTAGNHTVVATPAVGVLIAIVAANTGRTTAQPPTISDNNADGRGTYALVRSQTKNTSADSLWIYVRNSLVGSATSTTFTAAQSGDTGGGLVVMSITTMSIVGLAAVRGQGGQDNQAAAGTPTVVFGQAVLTANGCIGAVFNASNTSGMTPPSSWSEDVDTGWASPTTGFEEAHISFSETRSSIPWGSTSASAFCALAIELDGSQPLVYSEGEPRLNLQAVNRAAVM